MSGAVMERHCDTLCVLLSNHSHTAVRLRDPNLLILALAEYGPSSLIYSRCPNDTRNLFSAALGCQLETS